MSESSLNRKLKSLLATKQKYEEQIQQATVVLDAQTLILNQAEAEHNVNMAGNIDQITVDVSTAVEGRAALQEGLSGIVEINEQGKVNDLAVGNSNLAMGATATGTNNEAVASENENLLSMFE